jgi:hypothetical protein
MSWRAFTRSLALRLLLLMAVTSVGPAGAASSWHQFEQGGHHVAADLTGQPPALASGSGSRTAGEPCAACQFGSTLRAFLPSPTVVVTASVSDRISPARPAAQDVDSPVSVGHAGRAPPRVA